MRISKSNYKQYLTHPALLWLALHEPAKIPPVSEAVEGFAAGGQLFESYAEQLFEGGVRIGFDGAEEYATLFSRTKIALDSGAKVLFQAGFAIDNFTCIADVVEVVDGNTFNLYEIKASTGAKAEFTPDLAFQANVIEQAGYKVEQIGVIIANKDYVRQGEIDVRQLCTVVDLGTEVKQKQAEVWDDMQRALSIAKQPRMPDPSPLAEGAGTLGDWKPIYRTLVDLPKYNVYDLARVTKKKLAQFIECDTVDLMEVDVAGDNLSYKHQLHITTVQTGEPLIDRQSIVNFLGDLVEPIYFLDYETYASVVPVFDGEYPYQQVPCQYSLHVLREGQLEHYEYVHRDKTQPIAQLSAALQSQIGNSGSVIVWFQGFEKSRNTEMGQFAPEFTQFYADLNERIVDLMEPFSKDMYVHKDFHGSASIKKVLPVLVPELSYKSLSIQNGSVAQAEWMRAVLDDSPDKQQVLDDLLKYCELDTLAMVEIYRVLKNL